MPLRRAEIFLKVVNRETAPQKKKICCNPFFYRFHWQQPNEIIYKYTYSSYLSCFRGFSWIYCNKRLKEIGQEASPQWDAHHCVTRALPCFINTCGKCQHVPIFIFLGGKIRWNAVVRTALRSLALPLRSRQLERLSRATYTWKLSAPLKNLLR